MGEDRPPTSRRVTAAQAADELGISVEAVRGRIKRGTLVHEKAADGTVYVLLAADQSRPAVDQSTNQPADQPLIVTRLENEVQFLREELARKDAILLSMTEAMKALNPPAAEQAPEARESDISPGPGPTPPSGAGGPQEAAPPRSRAPWWRRVFGGWRQSWR